ncbi:Ankyrin repeat-containing protein [Colletotrichum camelliae]|nr:Ankyrin repeat-containing protein [Colletotrichum camelliae]
MAGQARFVPDLAEARVQWWDDNDVYVRCPGCGKIHHHSFDGRYEPPLWRMSHCDVTGLEARFLRYKIVFPFDVKSGDVGYEIDRQRAMFVCGTADPTAYFGELGEEQPKPRKITFRNRKKWTDAKEQVHYSGSMTGLPGGYSVERIIVVVSDLVEGRVEAVRRYLESSPDAHIFLHGVEAHRVSQLDDYDSDSSSREGKKEPGNKIHVTGNTALHCAACEKSDDMISVMEAALWGRLRNVELLLEDGADTETYCIRNGQRLRAVDFAMPLEENIAERESLAGGVYRENTPERDRDRAAVVRLLRGRAESPPPDRELAGFAFHHSPDNERSLVMIATFDIPNKWKTVAVLYRGGRFPGVAAMSGWGHGEKLDIQVSGKDWTQEVYDLCERIGFSLRPHDRDQGSRGRYHACHAEKQLVAYFISKHLLCENVED